MVRAAHLAAVGAACCVLSIHPLPMARVRTPMPSGQVHVAKHVPTNAPTRTALHHHAMLVTNTAEDNPMPSLWDTSQPSQNIWEWAIPIFAFGATLGLMVAVLAQSPVHAVAAQDQARMEAHQCGIHSNSTTGLPVNCDDGGELEDPMPKIGGNDITR